MNTIYGVDPTLPITPPMVRDAIIECFYQAHNEFSGINEEQGNSRSYCQSLVQRMFDNISGNFANPSKDDLMNVVNELKSFSRNFRTRELITKHAKEITSLIEKLP